eukprot:6213621-Pleurochrysis_carterae.AAC.3
MSRGTSFFASTYIMPMGDACASRMRVASSATRGTTLTASSAASKLQNEVLLKIASQRNVSAALVAAPSVVESLLLERRIDCTICDTRAALSPARSSDDATEESSGAMRSSRLEMTGSDKVGTLTPLALARMPTKVRASWPDVRCGRSAEREG